MSEPIPTNTPSVTATIAVVGAGSWATALAWVLAHRGHTIRWWVREPDQRSDLAQTGRNPSYVPEAELPTGKLILPESLSDTLAGADAALLAVPSKYLEVTLAGASAADFALPRIASAIKGLVPETGGPVSAYMADRFGVGADRFAVVTGPSHAEEVIGGALTYLTCGAADAAHALWWADRLQGPALETRLSDDVEGLEYGGILKNLYAIAMGLAVGLGYGDNFRAVLASACIQELETHLAEAHPNPTRNVTDSAYLGDLLVTVYSQYSRNRQLGQRIGSGEAVAAALSHMAMVAEGYTAAQVLFEGKAPPSNLPIAEAVYQVLHQHKPPTDALQQLVPALR